MRGLKSTRVHLHERACSKSGLSHSVSPSATPPSSITHTLSLSRLLQFLQCNTENCKYHHVAPPLPPLSRDWRKSLRNTRLLGFVEPASQSRPSRAAPTCRNEQQRDEGEPLIRRPRQADQTGKRVVFAKRERSQLHRPSICQSWDADPSLS
ncbi:hypothetical protein TcWFU_000452 [Taenia crassiceps]|uniref:Uncharacterized protein n=1 Tax=Taenia crassiceps TaxID=6207 RepID=A0ABR4Q211_9CEST